MQSNKVCSLPQEASAFWTKLVRTLLLQVKEAQVQLGW